MDPDDVQVIENSTIDDGLKQINKISGVYLDYIKTQAAGVAPKAFMLAYSVIVKLCDQDEGSQQLFNHYIQKMKAYITEIIIPQIDSKSGDSKEFLTEYVKQWENFSLYLFCMKRLVVYLDRYHLKTANQQSLTETALNLWRTDVYKKKLSTLRRSILAEIKKDRQNDMVEKELIKSSVQ